MAVRQYYRIKAELVEVDEDGNEHIEAERSDKFDTPTKIEEIHEEITSNVADWIEEMEYDVKQERLALKLARYVGSLVDQIQEGKLNPDNVDYEMDEIDIPNHFRPPHATFEFDTPEGPALVIIIPRPEMVS